MENPKTWSWTNPLQTILRLLPAFCTQHMFWRLSFLLLWFFFSTLGSPLLPSILPTGMTIVEALVSTLNNSSSCLYTATFQGWRTSGHKLKRSGFGDPAKHLAPLTPSWPHLDSRPPWRLNPCPVDQHCPQLQPGILHSSVQRPCQQGDQGPGILPHSPPSFYLTFSLLSSSPK